MRNVLITGGTGFLGRALAKRLLDGGSERVCIFSRGEHAQAQMRDEFDNDPRLRFFIGDVRDRDRLRRAMSGVEVVIHAAALKRIEVGKYNPEEMIRTNVLGTMNVIEAAREAGADFLPRKVVFVSSDKAYQPVSPYGQSKALAESLVLNATDHPAQLMFSACRYGNVWGSTGSVTPRWKAMVDQGATEVPVTDPDCTRFFMRIEDAVDLVLTTVHNMPPAVVVPDLPAYRLGDLAEAMGVRMRITGLPDWEKKHESMDDAHSSETARRMTVAELKEALCSIG